MWGKKRSDVFIHRTVMEEVKNGAHSHVSFGMNLWLIDPPASIKMLHSLVGDLSCGSQL
jgi:hypothetical protein